MDIVIPIDPVTTTQEPDVDFVLGDNGGAFVSVTLMINDASGIKARLIFDHAYGGSLAQSLALSKGTYPCTLAIHAYKDGALKTDYKSFVKISGSTIASANGLIPQGADDEFGYRKFTLTVA